MELADQSHDLPVPSPGFEWRAFAAGQALVCLALEPYAAHLFTTKGWRLGMATTDDRDAGWRDVADAIGVDGSHLARVHQVHGAAAVLVRRGEPIADRPLPHADILVGDDPSIALAIQMADCVPMLIADRRTGAVAAAHAGWRGLAADVPGAAVRALCDAFGSRAADLIVAVGPSISAALYEVDAVVRRAFEAGGAGGARLDRWFLPGRRPDRWQFDGWQASIDLLEAGGVPRGQIHGAALCTAVYPLLCSYRRDAAGAGRMAAAIRRRL
jgi:purine-nucleoside/S-methyl-5'-thioadenosine phosphorylase / adenosine deaminase